jgi:anti-sigma-K factor RskA
MTDPTDDMPEGSPEALAAEYALGLLEGEARAAFEVRMRAEPALAAAVTAWQARFATLAETEVDPVSPPPRIEAALEHRLFGGDGTAAPSVWRRLGLWQALTALGAATSVALAVLLYTEPQPPARPFAAQLAPTEGEDSFLAVYDPDDATLNIRRAGGAPRPGRAQELWLIAGEAAPVSLGLLEGEGRAAIPVPEDLRDALPGATLAVSDEPPGGSPTGAPTGDVLALGPVAAL